MSPDKIGKPHEQRENCPTIGQQRFLLSLTENQEIKNENETTGAFPCIVVLYF